MITYHPAVSVTIHDQLSPCSICNYPRLTCIVSMQITAPTYTNYGWMTSWAFIIMVSTRICFTICRGPKNLYRGRGRNPISPSSSCNFQTLALTRLNKISKYYKLIETIKMDNQFWATFGPSLPFMERK